VARANHRQFAASESFVAGGAWLPIVVLVEAVWVLDTVYRRSRAEIADGIALLLDHRDLVLQDADVIAAALYQFRRHPRVGFSDCLILEQARKAGHVPLGTFDRAFSRLEGTVRV
jgi:predicted nucleic-acid-binding protein